MEAALLAELQAAETAPAGCQPARVLELLIACGAQLLQLEQQYATSSHSKESAEQTAAARQLHEWVTRYTTVHERDAFLAPSSSGAIAAGGASAPPAPLLFFFLCSGGEAGRACALAWLSALYNDPRTDQDRHWLNDPLALVAQVGVKLRLTREENRALEAHYATHKIIDTPNIRSHLAIYSGICDVLATLLHTRARALGAQSGSVRALMDEAVRERTRTHWQLWMASSDAQQGSSNLLALEAELAAIGTSGWHQRVAAQRRRKTALHARAFRAFLQPVGRPLLAELAPLLVDAEFSEESELCVDRLWSLATGSAQHQPLHADQEQQQQQGGSSNNTDGKQVRWSYPPPSVHALLDMFLLTDNTPEVSSPSASTSAASSPPPSYKLWLVYYMLLDFEQRHPTPATGLGEHADSVALKLSVEFALSAGLSAQQQLLITAMLHLDAAYAPPSSEAEKMMVANNKNSSNVLSSTRQASFLSSLECFSSSFESVLSQPDFPFVSSVLASVLALQQWSGGVAFFQNCFLANSAAATASAAAAFRHAQLARFHAVRKQPQLTPPAPVSAAQQVFYSPLHHALYVHILLQQGLAFEAVQFIRDQASSSSSSSTALESSAHTPLQLVLWRFWNASLLHARQYDVLLKQISYSRAEERVVLGFWKRHLTAASEAKSNAAGGVAAAASSAAPAGGRTLSTGDLVILYALEHHDIPRGLRFYVAFQRRQKKLHPSHRLALRLPEKILEAYAKLVHFDLAAALATTAPGAGEEDEDNDEIDDDDADDELDVSTLQLRAVERAVDALAVKNKALLGQILAAPSSAGGARAASSAMADVGGEEDSEEGSVDMADVSRAGAELNPFSTANEAARSALEAAAAAAAAARAKSAAKAATKAASSPAKLPPPSPRAASASSALPPTAAGSSGVSSSASTTSLASPTLTGAAGISAVAPPHSPEKTPRVQRVSANQSAAKAKRAAQAKEDAEHAAAAAAEQAKNPSPPAVVPMKDADNNFDVEPLDEEHQFPSFISPSPQPPRETASPRLQAAQAHQRVASSSSLAAAAAAPAAASVSRQASSSRLSRAATLELPPATPAGSAAGAGHSRSPSAVLLSTTKPLPLAFSDLTPEQAATNASFLLPLPDAPVPTMTLAPAAPPAAVATRTLPKRSTRASKIDAAPEQQSASEASSPALSAASSAAPPPFQPLSSAHFTPSLLAPSALTTTQRIRSSRKRPLAASQAPVVVAAAPVVSSAPVVARAPSPALLTAGDSDGGARPSSRGGRTSTRASRSTRAAAAAASRMDDVEATGASTAVGEDESVDGTASESTAEDRPSRRTSPRAPSSRARVSTRRTAAASASDAVEAVDASMEDVAAPASSTRSTRRGAAAASASASQPPVADNPFQRGPGGRRSRAQPIFLDESLLLGAPPSEEHSAADNDDDAESTTSRRSTRRAAAAAASAILAPRSTRSILQSGSASPSPSPSTNTSPSRPTRARKAASSSLATPAPAAASSRSTRASRAADAVVETPAPAPASVRATRSRTAK